MRSSRRFSTANDKRYGDSSLKDPTIDLVAFYQDQLVDAFNLISKADTELYDAKAEKDRQSNIAYLGKNFIIKYWWQILLVIIILAILTPPTWKLIIKSRRKQRLIALKEELTKTREMIKELQKACFVDKIISPESYKQRVIKYDEHIAYINHTIPVLEAELAGRSDKKESLEPKGILEIKR